MGAGKSKYAPPVVMGDESIMRRKKHGSCTKGVQKQLRFGVERKKADTICCYNRRYAELARYYQRTGFVSELKADCYNLFYDSVHGKRVVVVPVGRSLEQFLRESDRHGWPSFRDREIDWENVRVLRRGEVVTIDGVHLGHNLPDHKGNRYCLNLVSIAGYPESYHKKKHIKKHAAKEDTAEQNENQAENILSTQQGGP